MRGPGNPSGYPSGGLQRPPGRKGFPRSLTDLNARFGTWGASFSHAWGFDELGAGDDVVDLAPSGGINLITAGANCPSSLTGYPGGDRGRRTEAGIGNFNSPNANDLEVTTTDFVFLLETKVTAGGAFLWRKFSGGGSKLHRGIIDAASGHPFFQFFDGAGGDNVELAVDHRDGSYHTLLYVVDRQTATKAMSLTSDLGTVTGTAPTGSMSAAAFEGFQIGNDVDAIVTFAAWGTTQGTLHANRVAAVAAWRRSIGAA